MLNYDDLAEISAAEHAATQQYQHRISVCVSAGCLSAHSGQIKEALEARVQEKGLGKTCQVKGVGCMGPCAAGPLVSVETDNVLYRDVKVSDASDIVDSVGAKPVERLVMPTNTPFFERQVKVVLENSGRIDPERIEDYIAAGGYKALFRVLTELMPVGVLAEITRSGLRGRGGAGYPTGLKWSTVAKAVGAKKYVVCNGDEGDPGAFMDRSVMEADPHRVLEGMAIAAYAIGADQGYIYIRAEYPLAIKRVEKAIRQAQKMGFLGKNIVGTPFSFSVDVRVGAGAFVCGEETALMASVEGRRGTPRPRPPYPAASGLWHSPTLINNVESFANVPTIIRNGSEWFARIGTEKSKGTKVFALSGNIKNVGLIEVPMGIKLRDIIFEIGGGIPDGHHFKAVQTGGPGGGCIPAEHLDVSVDYESLTALGSFMGSGGMIVMDATSSMIGVARYFMEFCMTESCGKCVPCRVGTAQIYDLLDKFVQGDVTQAELDLLEALCDMVKTTSLCGLGQAAPNPVLSTLRYFRQEYLDQMAASSERAAAHVAAAGD